jgi:large subunit ribosomal protein L25
MVRPDGPSGPSGGSRENDRMAETFTVQLRSTRGKQHARRVRRGGAVPAVLYGHGQETLSLAIPAEQVAAAVRHGSRLVELTGAVQEKALLQELQWDTYGAQVLHVDLARVSEDETVHVKVPVELRGKAAGATEGGIVEHVLHELEIECRATQIPDKLQVGINELRIGAEVRVADLKLPEGVRVLAEPDSVVVQCVAPRKEEEEPAAEVIGAAEPELIGRKPAEEEAEGAA